MTESDIRDKLIGKLEIIEPGLRFKATETYLPSELGTTGFIDILATDLNDKHVIIELKKSNSAAREALHEILKYLEGIKELKSLRDDEIRIIIISTVWNELLIPFSSFCQKSTVDVRGFELIIDDIGTPVHAKKVLPIKLVNERLLADEAILDFHTDRESLARGIKSQEDCFRAKGIEDYILVIMHGPRISRKEIHLVHKPPPDYDYAIYSTTQRLTKEACLELLSRDAILEEYVLSELDLWDNEEEKIRFLHANILEIPPFPDSDDKRIGTADKFSQMTWNFGWEVEKIIKYGRLEKNDLLSDETLISEICGSTGTNRSKYDCEFKSNDPHVFSRVRAQIRTCLVHNLPWQHQILFVLDELEALSQKKNFNVKIAVYNPMNLLYAIYMIIKYKAPEYIPMYTIKVSGNNIDRLYVGSFDRNANKPSLKKSLDDHFDGNPRVLLFGLTTGGYFEQNIQLTEDNGLDYATFRILYESNGAQYQKLTNFSYRPHGSINPIEQFFRFMELEKEFCQTVYDLFAEHDLGNGIISI